MIFMPIPRRLLPHEISYEEYKGNAGPRNGSSQFETAYDIRFTRLVPSEALRMSNDSEGVKFDYMLFLDASNTKPFIEPVIKSKVLWQGKELVIVGVEDLYTDTKLHHYEVKLKG